MSIFTQLVTTLQQKVRHDPPLTAEQRHYRWQNAGIVLVDYIFTLVLMAIVFGLPAIWPTVIFLAPLTLFLVVRWIIVPQARLDENRLRWEQRYSKPSPNPATRLRNNGLAFLVLLVLIGFITQGWVSLLGGRHTATVLLTLILFSCLGLLPYFDQVLAMTARVVSSVASASLMLVPLLLLLLLAIELWHPVLGAVAMVGLWAWFSHFLHTLEYPEYELSFTLFFIIALGMGVSAFFVNHPVVWGMVIGVVTCAGALNFMFILFMEYIFPPLFRRLKQWVTAQMRRWFPTRVVSS